MNCFQHSGTYGVDNRCPGFKDGELSEGNPQPQSMAADKEAGLDLVYAYTYVLDRYKRFEV